MRLSDFDEWARAHHGIITREASGWSKSAWHRAIEAGDLMQIHPNVARLPGTALTPEQRIIAGVLALGAPAVASHRSAARLWLVPRPDDDPVDVLLLDERRDVDLDGVVVHRTTDREHLRPQRRFNIACTNIVRTLLDLGAVDGASVTDAVGHAIATRMVTADGLHAALAAHAVRGRAGIDAFRHALEEWAIDRQPADHLLDTAMARLVRNYAVAPLEFRPVIEGIRVDFRVVDLPIAIQCDGWAYHGLRPASFERDHEHDATLTAAGWTVLRFTYRAITTRPAWTARTIRQAIDRWQPAGELAGPPDAA